MIFYYAFDREMLNSIGFPDKSKESQKFIESTIEKDIKALAFFMPLDERIVISPSFRFESLVCRRILKNNQAFLDNGLIAEYRREMDIKDFWLKKNETYRSVMDISDAYQEAYNQKSIYEEVSSLWIDCITKRNAIGMISRDTFMDNVSSQGEKTSIPIEQVKEVLKITEETRETTFLWEREEYMLYKYGVSSDVIRRLGVRNAMNQSYIDVFADQNIKICKPSIGVVDIGNINPAYDMWKIRAALERVGILDIIFQLSAGEIIYIRRNTELQDMLDVIRNGVEEKKDVDDIYSMVKSSGGIEALVRGLILQKFRGSKMDINKNMRGKDEILQEGTVRMLHLSDLHFTDEKSMEDHLFCLKLDLAKNFKISSLEYLIISGDVSDRPTEDMYGAALKFVQKLADEFNICKEHIVLIPGNHDCDRDISKEAYDKKGKNVVDQDKYNDRYAKYNRYFYEPIKGKDYPAEPAMQFDDYIICDDNLCILALNSSWQIDHKHTERSSICMEAIQKSKTVWCDEKDYVKLAVWHHPLSGEASIQDTTFMDILANAGFKACFHGHIHEAKNALFTYDAHRSIRMVGAGTFGAVKEERGDGIPRQYNMIEFDKKQRLLIVHTRKREKDHGAWQADARWEDRNHNPKSYYIVEV